MLKWNVKGNIGFERFLYSLQSQSLTLVKFVVVTRLFVCHAYSFMFQLLLKHFKSFIQHLYS